MTVEKSYSSHAAGLPRRSGTKAGVLDCGGYDVAFLVGHCLQARCSRADASRLIKPVPTYPRLSKQFSEKKDCLKVVSICAICGLKFGSLWKAIVGYGSLRKTPGGQVYNKTMGDIPKSAAARAEFRFQFAFFILTFAQ
jgi:hypothetical protein